MTRGRRRNHITLSGRARRMRNDEVEIEGTDIVFIDDLAARGVISSAQHRAARYLVRDKAIRNERYVEALALVKPLHREHLISILDGRGDLEAYGRLIMGYRVKQDAELWALQRLRLALNDLGDVYRGRGRGREFPGYGTSDDLDLEDSEE